MPPKVVEKFMDAGPKCSSFLFFFYILLYLSTDPVLRIFLFVHTTVVWPVMMEAFAVMFSGKFVTHGEAVECRTSKRKMLIV